MADTVNASMNYKYRNGELCGLSSQWIDRYFTPTIEQLHIFRVCVCFQAHIRAHINSLVIMPKTSCIRKCYAIGLNMQSEMMLNAYFGFRRSYFTHSSSSDESFVGRCLYAYTLELKNFNIASVWCILYIFKYRLCMLKYTSASARIYTNVRTCTVR